ncbi:DMT family transporter [Pseudarthrobacter sp. HLT1-5]|nr:DMT family transporter [Pseudarthrobacter sp. HLT1-5]
MSAPTYVATREALKSLSPQDLTPVRFLSAAVILGAFLLLKRQRLRLTVRDLPRTLVVALLGYAGCGLLMNLGQTTVPAGTASLLLNISPIFAFFLGYLVLRERTSKRGYLGIVTALAGVIVITLGGSAAVGFNADALYIVAAALVLSVFLIVQQPLLNRVHPVEVVFWGSAIGGLASLPAAKFDTDPSSFTESTWLALAVLTVMSTALASSFWNLSLLRTSVAEGGALLYVVPVFSLLLGWLLLGEAPNTASMLGGAAALAGVFMLSQTTPSVIQPEVKDPVP